MVGGGGIAEWWRDLPSKFDPVDQQKSTTVVQNLFCLVALQQLKFFLSIFFRGHIWALVSNPLGTQHYQVSQGL